MFSFRKKPPEIFAHTIAFDGRGVYQLDLPEVRQALVFEDDGRTGYLYVTNAEYSEAEVAVHLYDYGDEHQLNRGESALFIWSPSLKKAGFYYRNRFQAGVDFQKHEARSRTGFPPNGMSPWLRDHTWNESIVAGLEP
jgi:hypothetical protein